MTQYNTLNLKLSNLKIDKLKSAIENDSEVTFKLLSNVVGDSNDENNFAHKFLLTNTKVSKSSKGFENSLSANIELSQTQLDKIRQSGGFLGRLLATLLKNGLPLEGNIFKSLAESVLMSLGLTAAASPTDVAIHKIFFGFDNMTLIISNKDWMISWK